MKFSTLSALALSVAIAGFSGSALAQNRTTPAGKLFFEGDIVRHALMGQQGPFCILNNRYTRGEAVAWRVRVQLPDGMVADNMKIKAVEVELGNGQKLPLHFGGHGMPATDFFWSTFWTVPMDFPTGKLGYKVNATMNDGSVVTWEPFTRDTTQLMVVAGEPGNPARN
ncbi:MAG TPA: hypothetical protein VHT51_18825 [Micropepsaceae bacterium]|jgi:hypothetical protein|nr:hypothetical protein [Micropepsaceae bacterium]